jgi:hypothetical protein
MRMPGRKKQEQREERAAAFLKGVETPDASSRLKDHGLQRILAKVESPEGSTITLSGKRRVYRSPTLVYRVAFVLLLIPLVLAMLTTGAYALSYDAQPDSALYGTKIFFERTREALTSSPSSDMRLEIEYSNRRLNELEKMAASGKQKGADRWLREYERNVGRAYSLIDQVSQQDFEDLSVQLLDALNRQAAMMETMSQGQYPDFAGQIEQAYGVCNQERERMRQRCSVEDGGCMESPSDSGGPSGNGNGQKGQDNNQGPGQYNEQVSDPESSQSGYQDSGQNSGQGNQQNTNQINNQDANQGATQQFNLIPFRFLNPCPSPNTNQGSSGQSNQVSSNGSDDVTDSMNNRGW